MPFTLCHPAIILPIARRPLVPSALVMGSVAPDLPYFFGLRLRGLTHRPPGMVTVDLGFALVLLAVYHLLLKWPLIALWPAWARGRLAVPAREFDRRTMGDLGWVMISAVIGVAGHLLWDGFTHEDGSGIGPIRRLGVLLTGGGSGYDLAQSASGVVGGVAMALWTARWLRRAPAGPEIPPGLSPGARRLVLLACAAAAGTGGVYGATVWLPVGTPPVDFHTRTVGGVVGAVSATGLVLLAYALGRRVVARTPAVPAGAASVAPSADAGTSDVMGA
ncbi:MAG TPA: DUF4184 family protein [Actinomadura sp.]|nr:DUF4184 family protein [Actinomadura sp.]